MIYKLIYKLIKCVVVIAIVLAACGWFWLGLAVSIAVLKGVFSLIFGG